MLRRKITRKLEQWKESNSGKCLIVEGARQVGKTYSIREFGESHYASLVELNFIENPSLGLIFQGDLNPDQILSMLSLYVPGARVIDGDTLIFLDEIQECSEAITALKFLAGDPRFDVICSGSALGMEYRPETSFPVGSVEYLTMTSLDLVEFLWAMGVSDDIVRQLQDYANKRDYSRKIPGALHQAMLRFLRQYLVLGGMPEVIQSFVDTGDYRVADEVQRRLYRDYISDIARYARPEVKIKAEKCYRTIPMQLSKENHKFQYGKVEKKGTSIKFESSIDWLASAHMVIPVYNVRALQYPLKAAAIENNFRIYPSDIGLLICAYGYELKSALMEDSDIEAKPVSLLLGTAKGGIYEALAADMLNKAGLADLFFYRNETGTREIEFLLETLDGIIPLEIKAGRTGTRSLTALLEEEAVPYGYKFSSQNAGRTGKKITLPLYLLPFCVGVQN